LLLGSTGVERKAISSLGMTDCCGAEIVIAKGAIFPKCPDHPRSITIWKLVPNEKTETKKIGVRAGRLASGLH